MSASPLVKRLVIVQVVSNNECYVIDEGKLNETEREYLLAFMPEAEEMNLRDNSQTVREMEKLEEQLREIREERLELQ